MTTRPRWTHVIAALLGLVSVVTADAHPQLVPVPAGPDQVVIESRRLGERRPVLVYLPESYRHTQDRYPVLIVLDGDGPGATKAMSVVTNLSTWLTGSIPELVVVAIPNYDRARDLVPPPANGGVTGAEGIPAAPNAHADVFLGFIEHELIPEIDRRYRTHPVRFLHGSSYGGLFGIFAFVTRPELFRGIVASSPSLWVDKQAWVDSLRASLGRRPATQQRLYASAGEFDSDLIITPMPRLISALRAHAPTSLTWRVESLSGRDHQSANATALMNGLQHIFSDFQVPYMELARITPDDVRARYRSLSSLYGWPVTAPAWALNRQLLIQDAVGRPWQDVVMIAKAMADDFPWHPYGYDAQTWFYGVPGRDISRAVALEEEAIRVARSSGYWVGSLEAALASYRKQLQR